MSTNPYWDAFEAAKDVQPVEGGRIPLRFSGTTGRSATNNNPLNLEYRSGSYQDKYGAVPEPTHKGRFAKFPDMMSGYLAGLDQIKIDQGRGLTLRQFVHKFAPPHENPTEKLITQYASTVGASADTPLSQIAPEKLIVPMMIRESSTRIIGPGGTPVSKPIPSLSGNPYMDAYEASGGQAPGLEPAQQEEKPPDIWEFVNRYAPGPSQAEAAEIPRGFGLDRARKAEKGKYNPMMAMAGAAALGVGALALPDQAEANPYMDAFQAAGGQVQEPLAEPVGLPGEVPPVPTEKPEPGSEDSYIYEAMSAFAPMSGRPEDFQPLVPPGQAVRETIDTLKSDVAGAPMYEWLSTLSLWGGVPMAVSKAWKMAKLARVLGSTASRILSMATTGAAIQGAEDLLKSTGYYHPWSEGPTMYGLLEKPPESELARMGISAADWALFQGGIEGVGALHRVLGKGARTGRYVSKEAEKLFREQVGEPSEWAKKPEEYKYIRDQIAPYRGPVERLGDATWRKYVGEPLWNLLSKVGDIPIPTRGKTLTEAFQPAIERLRKGQPSIAKDIDQIRLSRALAEEGMEFVARTSQQLTPFERYEFEKGLMSRSKDVLTSPKVIDMMDDFYGILNSAGSKTPQELFVNEFERNFDKHMGKPLRELERQLESWLKAKGSTESVDAVISHHLKRYSQVPEPTIRNIHDSLNKMIGDPTVPEPLRRYGIELYNLPAMTPTQVRRSSVAAVTEAIGAQLKNNPEAVSGFDKPGFVASKHDVFKDLYVHKDVELEMDAMKAIQKYASGMYQQYFLTPWKTNKVVLRPSAHFRNLYSNLMLNDWGGLPFYRMDLYNRALKEMRAHTNMFKEFHKMTAQTGRFATEEVKRFTSMAMHGDNMFKKLFRLYDAAAAPARNWYGSEETWFKYAKYLHNLEKGYDKESAALDAIKWTFNYSEVTPATAMWRSSVVGMPFFTWMTKAIPLFLETQIKYPLRVGKWWAFMYGMHELGVNNAGLGSDEWKHIQAALPDYMQKGLWMMMPWRDQQGRLKMMNLTWMLPGVGDIAELYGRGADNIWGLALQNPITNLAGSLANGRTELGIPIWYDWEPAATKYSKAIAHAWKWWAPSLAPGGLDWNTLVDAFQGRPESLSPWEAVASQFGFRLKTVHPGLAMKRRAALRRIHEGEANVMRQREHRQAISDKEHQEIEERYGPILRDIHREGLFSY